MPTKIELLRTKETEIAAMLRQWMRESGVFDEGDSVEVAILLHSKPRVKIETRTFGNRKYRVVSTDVAEADWPLILEAGGGGASRTGFETLRNFKNAPVDGVQMPRKFSHQTANILLTKAGLKYRVKIVGRNQANLNWMYQLAAVETL